MPQAPDTTDYVKTTTDRAYKDWGRSDDQYQWAKDQFAKNQATSDKVVGQALDTSKAFSDASASDRGFWEGSYKPAMQQQLDYAKEYTTPERMAANRGQAIAGVNTAFDANRAAAERTLGSYDINPSSGRFAGLDAGLAAKRAAAAAGVGTQSDRQTEMMGQQLLDNAIKTGSVLPGQAANEAGVSLAAGNAAANTGLATTASGAATMGTPMQWEGLGNDMIKEWMGSELKAGQLDAELQKNAQSGSSGIGALIGAGAGILGTIAGGPVGGMIGSKLGSMVGSAATSPASMGGGGSFGFRRGGKVRRMQQGGPVEEDMTDQYNTELSPEEQQEYDQWIQRNSARHGRDLSKDNFDYDTRGQFKDSRGADLPLGHGPDTHKKPNHPTFSNESRYHGAGGRMGGQWDADETGSETLQPYNPARGYRFGGPVTPETDNEPDPALIREPYEDDYVEYPEEDGRPREDIDVRPPEAYADGGMTDDDMMVDTPEQGVGEGAVPPEASPSGGEQTDDVHALLNEGEFVMPKEVTSWYGEKFFQKMIQKAHDEMQSMRGAQGEPASPQQEQAVATSAPTFQTAGA